MSPSQIQPKREMNPSNVNNNNALCPPPLKINKDSHLIKKKSSSSSSSPSSILGTIKPQQRHPVIIYTHSPKVIHTHPQNFMALVQKLTGYSRNGDEDEKNSSSNSSNNNTSNNNSSQRKQELENGVESESVKFMGNEDNESSSVITEEHNSRQRSDVQVNSCLMAPPLFEPPPPPSPPPNSYMTNFPMFLPHSADYLSSNQPLFNYTDSLFFNHNMRSSVSSSAKLEGLDEYKADDSSSEPESNYSEK